jgi:hypothetical protein
MQYAMELKSAFLITICGLSTACAPQEKSETIKTHGVNPLAWIDTVRFNSRLTAEQQKQVYLVRNYEEDYEKLQDTARIALRFFWWRAFHPYLVIRVENRPEVYDSSGVRKLYEEWFALSKEGVTRLNHDCPVRKEDKCFGKPLPFVHQQKVVLLETNKMPGVINQLNETGFWQMKPEYNSPGMHTDGSNWTLEVFYKGKYKALSTNIPNESIKRICLEMLKASQYSIKPDEIY